MSRATNLRSGFLHVVCTSVVHGPAMLTRWDKAWRGSGRPRGTVTCQLCNYHTLQMKKRRGDITATGSTGSP